MRCGCRRRRGPGGGASGGFPNGRDYLSADRLPDSRARGVRSHAGWLDGADPVFSLFPQLVLHGEQGFVDQFKFTGSHEGAMGLEGLLPTAQRGPSSGDVADDHGVMTILNKLFDQVGAIRHIAIEPQCALASRVLNGFTAGGPQDGGLCTVR